MRALLGGVRKCKLTSLALTLSPLSDNKHFFKTNSLDEIRAATVAKRRRLGPKCSGVIATVFRKHLNNIKKVVVVRVLRGIRSR